MVSRLRVLTPVMEAIPCWRKGFARRASPYWFFISGEPKQIIIAKLSGGIGIN
jgi:hypothetical protein